MDRQTANFHVGCVDKRLSIMPISARSGRVHLETHYEKRTTRKTFYFGNNLSTNEIEAAYDAIVKYVVDREARKVKAAERKRNKNLKDDYALLTQEHK